MLTDKVQDDRAASVSQGYHHHLDPGDRRSVGYISIVEGTNGGGHGMKGVENGLREHRSFVFGKLKLGGYSQGPLIHHPLTT